MTRFGGPCLEFLLKSLLRGSSLRISTLVLVHVWGVWLSGVFCLPPPLGGEEASELDVEMRPEGDAS